MFNGSRCYPGRGSSRNSRLTREVSELRLDTYVSGKSTLRQTDFRDFLPSMFAIFGPSSRFWSVLVAYQDSWLESFRGSAPSQRKLRRLDPARRVAFLFTSRKRRSKAPWSSFISGIMTVFLTGDSSLCVSSPDVIQKNYKRSSWATRALFTVIRVLFCKNQRYEVSAAAKKDRRGRFIALCGR